MRFKLALIELAALSVNAAIGVTTLGNFNIAYDSEIHPNLQIYHKDDLHHPVFEAGHNLFEAGWGNVDDGYDLMLNGNLQYYPAGKGYSKEHKVHEALLSDDQSSFRIFGSSEVPKKHSNFKHREL